MILPRRLGSSATVALSLYGTVPHYQSETPDVQIGTPSTGLVVSDCLRCVALLTALENDPFSLQSVYHSTLADHIVLLGQVSLLAMNQSAGLKSGRKLFLPKDSAIETLFPNRHAISFDPHVDSSGDVAVQNSRSSGLPTWRT